MFPEPKPIQSKQLQDFLSKSGPRAGNSSCVYYAAYVYFEKLRIKEGKKKSEMRKDTEAIYAGQGGMSRELRRRGYSCARGFEPVEDKFGRVSLRSHIASFR